MSSALVSIILPNYNKALYLSETIVSVINQTHQNWELIIIDDNSTDNSTEIISKYLNDKRVRLIINEQNKGANFSRNIGLRKAKGKYIVFLDADDLLEHTCLENRLKQTNKYSDGNLFVFAMGVFTKSIGDDKRKWIPDTKRPLCDFLAHKLPWQTMQPIWKKEFLMKLGDFDESFDRMQDVELHTRALLQPSVKLYQFPDILDCYYRIDEERKNFRPYNFLERWINSSTQYCNKFEYLVTAKNKRYLYGTLLKLYQQIIYYLKSKKITAKEFKVLEEKLFSAKIYNQSSIIKKIIFKISYTYNLYLIRLPGINRILFEMVTL